MCTWDQKKAVTLWQICTILFWVLQGSAPSKCTLWRCICNITEMKCTIKGTKPLHKGLWGSVELRAVEKASEQLREGMKHQVCRAARGPGKQWITACYMLPSHGEEHIVQVPRKAEFGLNEQKDNLQTICLNPSEVEVINNYLVLWRKAITLWDWSYPSKQGQGQKVLGMGLTGMPPSEHGWVLHTLGWQLSRFHPMPWTQLPWHDNATVLLQGVL